MSVQNWNNQIEKTNQTITECGNCWGHQEWHGQICDKTPKRSNTSDDGFILKFVKKYLA